MAAYTSMEELQGFSFAWKGSLRVATKRIGVVPPRFARFL